jgi:hypothetical protein
VIGVLLRSIAEAGAAAARARLTSLPAEDDGAGGDHDDDPSPVWDGGWCRGAVRAPIHPGRVGGAIRPWAAVVHTTDMHPDTWGALLRRLARDPGRGAGAHFGLGREPGQLVQTTDLGRNANHAGGRPAHGWIDVAGRRVHPNMVTIGIEVHTAGQVVRDAGRWRTWSRKDGALVFHGAPIPDAEVEPDPRRPARGWHRPTAYQLRELETLLRALAGCPAVVPPPAPSQWGVTPSGREHLPSWAPRPGLLIGGVPVVGHVSLDPARKTDPGPVLSRWLAELAGALP